MIRHADPTLGEKERHYLAAELAPEALRLVVEVMAPRTGRLRFLSVSFWKALEPEERGRSSERRYQTVRCVTMAKRPAPPKGAHVAWWRFWWRSWASPSRRRPSFA